MSLRDDIKAYLDGELDDARRAAVEDALANNPELRREAEEAAQISRSIRHYARQPQVTGAEAALQAARRWSKLPPHWLKWGAGAAASLILIVAIGAQLLGQGAFLREAGVAAPAMEIVRTSEQAMQAHPGAPATDLAESAPTRNQPGPGAIAAGRQVSQRAEVELSVVDVTAAMESAAHFAEEAGGYVESRRYTLTHTAQTAHMVLRVPSQSRFEWLMNQLRTRIGTLKSESSATEDLTLQVADVDARLRALRAEEAQYIALLREARTVGEVLSVREQLNRVRLEIESLDAQQRALQQVVTMATINLKLHERQGQRDIRFPTPWAEQVLDQAFQALGGILRALATIAIFVLVLSPIWLPGILLVRWIIRKM